MLDLTVINQTLQASSLCSPAGGPASRKLHTLGARGWALLWKVAIPAVLPSIFVGLFMGLGLSFATLIVAEMLGVKAGQGWYVQ